MDSPKLNWRWYLEGGGPEHALFDDPPPAYTSDDEDVRRAKNELVGTNKKQKTCTKDAHEDARAGWGSWLRVEDLQHEETYPLLITFSHVQPTQHRFILCGPDLRPVNR